VKRPELSLDLSITDVTERYRDLVRRGQQMEAQRREERMTRPVANRTRYTTRCGRELMKERGFKIERGEWFDKRTNRWKDVKGAADVKVWSPSTGYGYFQFGAKGEAKRHYEKEATRRLIVECLERGEFLVWIAFDREGNILEEIKWA